jgi:hypothetical protein
MSQLPDHGAGGTPGGVGTFLWGMGLMVTGAYLLTQQVQVSSGPWMIWGYNAFGMSLIPLIIGLGRVSFDGDSWWGWGLVGGGLLIIFAGIISNLHIYFQPTSLFNTLVMVTLIAVGTGLVVKAIHPFLEKAERAEKRQR